MLFGGLQGITLVMLSALLSGGYNIIVSICDTAWKNASCVQSKELRTLPCRHGVHVP